MFKGLFKPVQQATKPAQQAAPAAHPQPAPATAAKPAKKPLPAWVESDSIGWFFTVVFAVINSFLKAAGVNTPEMSANAGMVFLRSLDWIMSPVVAGWIVSNMVENPSDRWVGMLGGAALGLGLQSLNYKISKDVMRGAPWVRKLGPIVILVIGLNIATILLDSLIDASWVFALAGRTDVLTSPGWQGYWNAWSGMSFILQGFWIGTFVLSTFGEITAAIFEMKDEEEPKPKLEPQQSASDPAAPATAEPHWLAADEVKAMNLPNPPRPDLGWVLDDKGPRLAKKPATTAPASRPEPH